MKKEPAYSKYISSGNTIYTSGQVAINGNGEIQGVDDINCQTVFVLNSLKEILKEKNLEMKNVISVTVYLQNIERDFVAMDSVYRDVFGDCKPARATVETKLVKPELLIEISAIASKESNNIKNN